MLFYKLSIACVPLYTPPALYYEHCSYGITNSVGISCDKLTRARLRACDKLTATLALNVV